MPELRVHHLPSLVSPGDLAGGTAVVVDVLRATTTIVYALAAGARSVIPCLTIDEAREVAAGLPRGQAILAGERGGLKIDGFDLGNSPLEFTREAVARKDVVLTTTNGTKALLHCRQADQVLVGAFANVSALCYVLGKCAKVDVVCAGTDGNLTKEDAMLAGTIAIQLMNRPDWILNIDARVSQSVLEAVTRGTTGEDRDAHMLEGVRSSPGGRNLVNIGMDRDIEVAARTDVFAIVPRFDPTTGRVTVRTPGVLDS
jgi:2-phosphosulfolactate phosphatase